MAVATSIGRWTRISRIRLHDCSMADAGRNRTATPDGSEPMASFYAAAVRLLR